MAGTLNRFNEYYVNVGPKLAKQNDSNQQDGDIWENDILINTSLMYMKPIDIKCIIEIVNQCKNKVFNGLEWN